MFTVVIMENVLYSDVKNYDAFFAPYEQKKEIALCKWIPSGQTVPEALPELKEIIDHKMEWRAVIVTNAGEDKGRSDNPFDYTDEDSIVSDRLIGDVNNDLIRLTYMLGGLPDICPEFEVGTANGTYNSFAHDNKTVSYKEKQRDKSELDEYMFYEDKFKFEGERPVSVLIFAARRLPNDYVKNRVNFSWRNVMEFQSSDFFGRNKYPDVCRFIVFNYTKNSELSMKRDYFKYFMCILTVALNRLPASSLQAYRLYECNIDIDEKELNRILSNQFQRLEFLKRGVLQGNMAKNRYFAEMSKADGELPELETKVSMEPYMKTPDLSTKKREYKLMPKNNSEESNTWWLNVRSIVEGYEKYIKEPQFALNNAVSEAKLNGLSIDMDIPALSPKQLLNINETIYNSEEKMVEKTPKMVFHSDDYKESFENAESKVRKILDVRLTRKSLIKVIVFVFLLYFILSAASIFANFESGVENSQVITTLIVVLVYCGVIVLMSFIALIFMRRGLYSAIRDFDSTVSSYIKNVEIVKSDYDNYLSNVATVLKCNCILNASHANAEREANEQQYRQKSLNILKSKINQISTIMYSFSFEPIIDTNCDYDEAFDIFEDVENNKAYHFEIDSIKKHIQVNESGDKIVAPYNFISRFLINRVEIYDKRIVEADQKIGNENSGGDN